MAEDLVQRGAADVEEGVEEGVAGAVDAAFEDEAGAGRESAGGASEPAADAARLLADLLSVEDHQAGVMEHRQAVQREAGNRLARVACRVRSAAGAPPPLASRPREPLIENTSCVISGIVGGYQPGKRNSVPVGTPRGFLDTEM